MLRQGMVATITTTPVTVQPYLLYCEVPSHSKRGMEEINLRHCGCLFYYHRTHCSITDPTPTTSTGLGNPSQEPVKIARPRSSSISDPTTEARARPALPPHIPHQIAHSFGPRGARGRARGASSSAPRTSRGTSQPPVPPRSKGKHSSRLLLRRGTRGPRLLVALHLQADGWQLRLLNSLSGSGAQSPPMPLLRALH